MRWAQQDWWRPEILEVDLPEAMDGDALESGDDTEHVEALLAPLSADFDSVFGDLDGLRLWDVHDLPPLYDMSVFGVQKKSAVSADVRAVGNHAVGRRAHGARGTVVSGLASGLFTERVRR